MATWSNERPEPEESWLDALASAEDRESGRPVLVAPVVHQGLGGPAPVQPDPYLEWMTVVPYFDAMVTLWTTVTFCDGTKDRALGKFYAPSGDLHQAWVQRSDAWLRLNQLPRPLTQLFPLQDAVPSVPLSPDPDWFVNLPPAPRDSS